MSLACRQEDRITHDRVSLTGKQTKRERLSGGQTPERYGARAHHHAHQVNRDPSEVKVMVGASWSEILLRTDSRLTRLDH